MDDQPAGGHTDAGLVGQTLSVGKGTSGQNVLAHGIVVVSRFMVLVAELLGLYHRFYAPDLPSFGKSEKPTHVLSLVEQTDALAEWTRVIRLQGAGFLGNSFGC